MDRDRCIRCGCGWEAVGGNERLKVSWQGQHKFESVICTQIIVLSKDEVFGNAQNCSWDKDDDGWNMHMHAAGRN